MSKRISVQRGYSRELGCCYVHGYIDKDYPVAKIALNDKLFITFCEKCERELKGLLKSYKDISF